MPPRKPLRLPLSAFSAPPPAPSTTSVEFSRTFDAHVDIDALGPVAGQILEGYSKGARKVVGAVGVTRASTPANAEPPVQRVVAIHPIPSPSSSTPNTAVDVLEFEVVQPATEESVWDEVDRVLDSVAKVSREVQASEDVAIDGVSAAGGLSGAKAPTVVLSGLLPPPLPSNISPTLLPHQPFFQTYVRQLSALALVPGVCLKFLPPTILKGEGDGAGWWEDEESFISVLKQYLIPALDSFGSHRILFGSSPSPLAFESTSTLTLTPSVPNAGRDWYPLVLKLMTSLKLDKESVGEIMAVTGGRVYGLSDSWKEAV